MSLYLTENKPKKELIQMLVRRGYDSDPVKTWKVSQNKLQVSVEPSVHQVAVDRRQLPFENNCFPYYPWMQVAK